MSTMEDSAEVEVTPKKVRKTRSESESGSDVKKTRSESENGGDIKKSRSESESGGDVKKSRLESESGGDPLEDKFIDEPEKVIHNGTGNSSKEDIPEENYVKEKTKAIKITKISKSSKTTPVKDNTKNVTASPSKKTTESPAKTLVPSSSSPSSSSLSDDFYGFQDLTDSNEQLRKKEAFNRFLSSLEDVGDKEGESEGEGEREAMTVEDADAADSDSNQMEIDEGNSRADSAEFSDKNDKGRTRDSDVDVMETDSVKSGGDASVKTEEEGVKAAGETAEAPESEPQSKVEYCGTCGEVVDDAEEGICCDGQCERWFHLKCSGLTQAEYDELGRDENAKWACNRCSGKPPPVIKPGAKPLLTVRKDLTAIGTPSPKRKMASKEEKRPRVDISNPIFLKPFDYGWKRELVYRSTTDSQNKKQGDVYYYTPKGKKLRSLREISEHLLGTDLTVDNFTFWKDALGCDPEKEIIRDAKIKLGNKDSNASPSPVAKKLGTPKTPKTPKTTPKLTATVTPLDSASGLPVAKASASVTPRVVLKTGKTGSISTGPKFKVTPSKTSVPPGQAQKIVISKDDENASTDHQLSRNIDVSKNDRSSRNEVRCSAKVKSQITKDNFRILRNRVDETENEGEDVDIIPKNKFRRYGLLANRISTRNIARKRRSRSTSSSSSSSSDDLTTPEKEVKASLISKLDSIKAAGLKPLENNKTESKNRTDNVGLPPLSSPMYNGTSNPPLAPDTIILPSPNMKRPRSPEIQFRPSDPSSYGCQTNAVPPCRTIGPNMSSPFRHPFETVLIVDTSPTEASVNPPKRRTALQKSPSPVQWTQDCSIQVFSVETLRSREFSNEGYLVASPSRQTGLPPKKQSAFFRAVESGRTGQAVARTVDQCSPRSVESSSTDVVLIEEDNSSPPFLIRNSPLGRGIVSPNRSPPSLQANLPPPPLLSCSPRPPGAADSPTVITINSAGNSITSLASSEETLESNETEKKKKSESDDEMEMGMLPPTWDPVQKPKENKIRPMDVCSIRCLPAMGLIPTLQCVVCLCLYHPECVGLGETGHTTIHNYKCKNCQMEKPKPAPGNNSKLLPPPPPLMPALSSISTSTVPMSHMMVPSKTSLQRLMDGKLTRIMEGPRSRMPMTKTPSIVGGVTTWLPPSSTIQLRSPGPASKLSSQKSLPPPAPHDPPAAQPVQAVMATETHRFIVVPKHNVLSFSPATTSAVPLPDPASPQTTTAASEPGTTLVTQAYGPGGPILPKPHVTTSAFIVGSPTTTTSNFQSPPGVLLVPYIAPQTSPTHKDAQPQYIVVNGPSGLQPGNFIIGNIPPQQQVLPAVPTSQLAEPPPDTTAVKRPLEGAEGAPPAKRAKVVAPPQNLLQNVNYVYDVLLQSFQYLKVQELLRASRVCHMWRDIALHKSLWETVKMKNSQVKDWDGFAATLRRTGTRHLDLRKMLMPDKPEALRGMWADCIKALSKINTLVKLDLCRCTSLYLEQIAAVCPQLEYIAAGAIKSNALNFANFKNCQHLTELRLKSLSGMEANNIEAIETLTKLKSLSLTTVKNMTKVLEVLPNLTNLEVLELGEMTMVSKEAVTEAFTKLTKLRRLRLEKGGEGCPTDTILETISQLPSLVQLELINFDVKAGFEEALGRCTNVKVLLIIPTYVTQSATTNHLVIEGVSKLSKTLVHFVWGLTLELLRVTDLFIDQWEMNKNTGPKSPSQAPKKAAGDSIPILKPQGKDGKKSKEGAVTQVDVLQLPKLHKVLTTLLPNTRIIILKVPFSATWRQTISGAAQ